MDYSIKRYREKNSVEQQIKGGKIISIDELVKFNRLSKKRMKNYIREGGTTDRG